jgi:hypothetical protein
MLSHKQRDKVMPEETVSWYYAMSGEQVGPISLQEIQHLVGNGKITSETKVWNGEGDWKSANSIDKLAELFIKPVSNVPPPLTGEDIDNKFIWAVVAVPIVGAIIELIVGTELVWFYIAANIVGCVLDEKKLKAAGQKAPTSWMVFLVPVYLWKRADLLNQKKRYFWAWVAAFTFSIIIGVGGSQLMVEEAACPVVTDIIKSQLSGSAICKAVNITNEVSSGFYKALATLDNGNELQITIEERKDGQIYVQIPNQ